jgi:hypothetical protein
MRQGISCRLLLPWQRIRRRIGSERYLRPPKQHRKQFVEIIAPFYQQLRAINPRKPLWIGATARPPAAGSGRFRAKAPGAGTGRFMEKAPRGFPNRIFSAAEQSL